MRHFNEQDRAAKEAWIAKLPPFLRARCQSCRTFHDDYDEQLAPLICPDAAVLDVACGKKGILEKYKGRTAVAVGVDLDAESLRSNPAVDLRVHAEASRLPFADGTFDVVLNQWFAEHVAQPAAVYSELARVLRPSGVLITVTNSVYNPMMVFSNLLSPTFRHRLRSLIFPAEVVPDAFPSYYRFNSRRAVRRVLSEIGLQETFFAYSGDISMFLYSPALLALGMMYEKATNFPGLHPFNMHFVATYRKPAGVGVSDGRNRPSKNPLSILACPDCHDTLVQRDASSLACRRCGIAYAEKGGVFFLEKGC
jgi:SAM-dependent methyltransferase